MTPTNEVLPFLDRVNGILGLIGAVLTYVLGQHWFLFASFMAMNVIDYITGCLKSRLMGTVNSSKGLTGLLKKLGYWLMIIVAFGASAVFIEIGEVIGVDLSITTSIGWFVLASLIINELRSIIENFVQAGYDVPSFLTKGLAVAQNAVESTATKTEDTTE